MGIRARMGPRQTMPRQRPEVEANKIQKPELVRALTARLGLKQSHVVPTLSSELTPVVVVDDLTQQAVRPEYWCAQFKSETGVAGTAANWYLYNPIGSGVVCKPKRFQFSPQHSNILNMVLNNINEPVAPITRKNGRRLVAGQPGQGIPPDFPPLQQTACSLWSGNVIGLPGATFYEMYMGDSLTVPNNLPPFEMTLPKILVYPGSALIWFLDATPEQDMELYVEWTEENLT